MFRCHRLGDRCHRKLAKENATVRVRTLGVPTLTHGRVCSALDRSSTLDLTKSLIVDHAGAQPYSECRSGFHRVPGVVFKITPSADGAGRSMDSTPSRDTQ